MKHSSNCDLSSHTVILSFPTLGQSNEGDGFTEEDGQDEDEDVFEFNECKSLLVPSGGKLNQNDLMDNSSSGSPFKSTSNFDKTQKNCSVIDLLVETSDLQQCNSNSNSNSSSSNFDQSFKAMSQGTANTYTHQSELEGLSIHRHENVVIEVSNLHHHTTT